MKYLSLPITNNRGAVIILGLLTLAVLSLLGTAAMTTSRTEIQIAGNEKASKEAFYTSEVSLKVGEKVVEDLLLRLELNEEDIAGHWGQGAQPAWDALSWADSDSVALDSQDIPSGFEDIAVVPRYTVEQRTFIRDSLTTGIGVPTGVYEFNVTGHGTGSASTSQVVVQTIYAKRYN